MSLCLAAAGLAAQIAASQFTLAWTHTIEKTAWEEEWRIAGGRLHLVQARVRGSGAGMEPPPEARLVDGFYVWTPQVAPLPELVLRRAEQAGDWTLCAASRCAALAVWLGGKADPVRLRSCAGRLRSTVLPSPGPSTSPARRALPPPPPASCGPPSRPMC